MDSYGIEEARNQLGELAERVRLNGERIMLTRYGKPAVVLMPASECAPTTEVTAGTGDVR